MECKKDRPTLIELKQTLQPISFEKRDFLQSKWISGGVPRGVICEITGTAKTEWLISVFIENPDLKVFWAEEKLSILPTAIQQRGVNLSRILLAEAGDRLFQTVRKALRSKLFDCVVLPGAVSEVNLLKALQLFARESNAAVFFLSKTEKHAWAIPFQLNVNWNKGSKDFRAEIIKTKFSESANG